MGGTNKTITIKKCSNCGKDVEIKHKKRLEAINTFCCKECESKYKKKQVVYNCKCSFCNKKIHVKPNLLEKYKTHFCSNTIRKKMIKETIVYYIKYIKNLLRNKKMGEYEFNHILP